MIVECSVSDASVLTLSKKTASKVEVQGGHQMELDGCANKCDFGCDYLRSSSMGNYYSFCMQFINAERVLCVPSILCASTLEYSQCFMTKKVKVSRVECSISDASVPTK